MRAAALPCRPITPSHASLCTLCCVVPGLDPSLLLGFAPSLLVSGTPAPGYFLAGGLCASLSHAIATPVDVVKTRQQTVPAYRGFSLRQGLARVWSEEGPLALLTGFVPTVVGYGLELSLIHI